jgi:myo-inositol-1(or 4)-monophosphatase
MNPAEIDLPFVCDLLREAGALALGQRGQMTAEIKKDHTPVTAVDRQVEGFLIERIRARYPDHPILSEESGLHAVLAGQPAAEFAWALDPIDGTRAFASGLPIWGVSAGVLYQGRPWAGGFYLPVTGELYWGTTAAAWVNQRQLSPLGTVDPASPLTFVGVPSNFHRYLEVSAPRIRSLGSTAAHLAYVATGAALGMLTRSTSLWDIAGVLPLALAAGVELTYLSGRPFSAGDLLDGGPLGEPLLACVPAALPTLRGWVEVKDVP